MSESHCICHCHFHSLYADSLYGLAPHLECWGKNQWWHCAGESLCSAVAAASDFTLSQLAVAKLRSALSALQPLVTFCMAYRAAQLLRPSNTRACSTLQQQLHSDACDFQLRRSCYCSMLLTLKGASSYPAGLAPWQMLTPCCKLTCHFPGILSSTARHSELARCLSMPETQTCSSHCHASCCKHTNLARLGVVHGAAVRTLSLSLLTAPGILHEPSWKHGLKVKVRLQRSQPDGMCDIRHKYTASGAQS